MKRLNLGVTTLYKLQSNRFYKNTLAVRKGAREEGPRRQLVLSPFPPKFGAIVVFILLPPPEQLSWSFLVKLVLWWGPRRAHGAISVCFPKSKPQQGFYGTAELLFEETGPFPRAWCVSFCSELNLTGTAQQSLEGPRPRGRRNRSFLLAHLECVWPFQGVREPVWRRLLRP